MTRPHHYLDVFRRREHSIGADLRRLPQARDFAERAAAEFGFDADACYQVKLALNEAVTNAIQHGSRSPADPVRIVASEESGRLVFDVLDTGRFVPRRVGGDDMAENGRGLEFMRLVMDDVDVRVRSGGTHLRLAKRLG